ncbi:ATP-binding protein [Flavihumibacter sp. CACIAM 22H1]|uniref:tetratricopeptide repeat-containing sensor histidine kinase n=1 Tax=Flavihumibacter sp. CACIAM 22H1 TaxID=1812911 RepID=UPI000AE48E75|nr:ATP-binding protein [Flavihumibacter sp. CACIAM 22H1]
MPYSGIVTKILLLSLLLFTGCRKNSSPLPPPQLPDLEKAEQLMYSQPDTAFSLLNTLATYSNDSLTVASALNYMAIIQHDAGDLYGSLESLLAALKLLNPAKETNRYTLQAVYNLLGTNSLNLKDYPAAIHYYLESLKLIEEESFKQIVRNNLGVAYQKKGEYNKAIDIFANALQGLPDTTIDYARTLSNLARTKWLENPAYPASAELKKALRIRTIKGDEWGLNASFAHLADFYAASNPDSARYYARQMYASASAIKSPTDRLEALDKLISYSPAPEAKSYFQAYRVLGDSLQTARTTAKNQFALIRYEAAKAKSENLALQKENAEKQVKLVRQKAALFTIVLVFLLAFVAGLIWYRKKQQQLNWMHQQKLREAQLKTSQKVHDVVANGLYRIMTNIEHNPALEKPTLLDDIEYLYEKSRNISYDEVDQPIQSIDFHQKISKLIKSFANDRTRVYIAGSDAQLWQTLNLKVKTELEQILQELMINMKKHSQASQVIVKFERAGKELKILYTDDGVGIPANLKPGNGWRNTENRISGLNGWFSFENNPPRGLKIQIHLPVEYST